MRLFRCPVHSPTKVGFMVFGIKYCAFLRSKPMTSRTVSGLALLTTLILCIAAPADEKQKAADEKSHDILENIKFRNLGPAVGGGRVTAGAGGGRPGDIFFVGGAAGGGV